MRFFLQPASRRRQPAEKINTQVFYSALPGLQARGSPDKNRLFLLWKHSVLCWHAKHVLGSRPRLTAARTSAIGKSNRVLTHAAGQ